MIVLYVCLCSQLVGLSVHSPGHLSTVSVVDSVLLLLLLLLLLLQS
jgi:hypothetical protein